MLTAKQREERLKHQLELLSSIEAKLKIASAMMVYGEPAEQHGDINVALTRVQSVMGRVQKQLKQLQQK